jgi:hypothetical protein
VSSNLKKKTIFALASKKRSNQKSKGTLIGGFYFDSPTLLFEIDEPLVIVFKNESKEDKF